MLRNLNDFMNCALHAKDGDIGHINDFYLDDKTWAIRYLIVDTGRWLSSRPVLISPIAILKVDFEKQYVQVQQTKEEVQNSPKIETELPVSRQYEWQYNGYYGYPIYWGGAGLWGMSDYPALLMPEAREGFGIRDKATASDVPYAETDQVTGDVYKDHHLRSFKELTKYKVIVKDEIVGHVKGMLINELNWEIRYFVVDTHHWWPSHEILVEVQRVLEVDWDAQSISVNLSQQAIKDAPLYDSNEVYTKENEIALQKHYEKQGYGLKL